MHTHTTINQFIELRAQGLSLNRIADQLGVSKRTLINWNRDQHTTIESLRALEIEALHEKILASHEQELTQLAACQSKIAEELAKRSLETIPTDKLLRLSFLVRQEIRNLCQSHSGSASRAATGLHETNGESSPIEVNQAQNISSAADAGPPASGHGPLGSAGVPQAVGMGSQRFQPADQRPVEVASAESCQLSESSVSQSKIENQKLKRELEEYCLHCGESLPPLLADGTRPSTWCAACSSPIAAPPGLSIRELCPACSSPIPVHGYNNNRFSSRCSECDTILPCLDDNAPLKWLPPDSKLQPHASSTI